MSIQLRATLAALLCFVVGAALFAFSAALIYTDINLGEDNYFWLLCLVGSAGLCGLLASFFFALRATGR